MLRILTFVAAVVSVAIAGSTTLPRWNSKHLTVQTSSGKVTGFIDDANPNVRQFLGIPFAQAPTEDLRWAPPVGLAKSSRHNKVQATSYPPSCPQYLTTRGNSIYTLDVLQFNLQGLNTTGAVSEDCLKVSVWTPTKKVEHDKLLPVLIYIYGGGFANGGIDVPYQIPTQWIQRTQEHIVVSFNYRVNIFGFPNAPGLKDQNLGILDQRLAVQWIYQNIKSFGGDPDRLTLWGQSAGAQSVDIYNYAWYQDPIVKGLIMDSGTAFLPILSKDKIQSSFIFVATHFGCNNTDSEAQLTCMRKIPATTIESFLQKHSDSRTGPSLSFAPIADEKLVFSDYRSRTKAGGISQIPAIIGTNSQDGVPFVPYPVSDPSAGVNTTAVHQAGLATFFCPATTTTTLRQQAGLDTFRYLYSGNFSNIAPRYWEGAYHSAELPLLFGTYDNFRGPGSRLEEDTSVAMQDAWVRFARDGVRGLESIGWKRYATGQADAKEFGAEVAVQNYNLASMEADCQ